VPRLCFEPSLSQEESADVLAKYATALVVKLAGDLLGVFIHLQLMGLLLAGGERLKPDRERERERDRG
jgi:hypothetical protein